jgi:dTDP-4-dehydrorhamnose reductase
MMRILLIGKVGQLGWELERALAPLGDLTVVDYPEIDLADAEGTRALVRQVQPEVIFNAAAYTAVDQAESEREIAMAVNGVAPGILAEEARAMEAAFVHYSTDYVFDGSKVEPYVEIDATNPVNTYGRSKLAGEKNVQAVGGAYLILRTSWVYSLRKGGFVNKVLGWSRKHQTLRIVNDQVGSPTWCRMLAEVSSFLLAKSDGDPVTWIKDRRGLYHLGGSGSVSRYQWAQAILKFDPQSEEQVVQEIEPASTTEFPTPAKRPLRTSLNCDHFESTFGLRLPDWETALRLSMETAP